MISVQTPIYLLLHNESNERVFHPGTVLPSPEADAVLMRFAGSFAPPVGSDVNVFFECRGKFFQQCGTVIATNEATPDAHGDRSIVFRCVGEPVSAETRGSFRVSVVDLQTCARVENERNCPVVDISAEGMGVITKKNYMLGTVVRIVYVFGGEQLEGRARVQTVRSLPNGTVRCGLLIPSTETETRSALRKMTAVAQRHHLRSLRQSA